jgi:ABC-type multidrug transport system fused ATPase/permease subunit
MWGSLGADKYDRQYDDGYLLRRLITYFKPHRKRVYTIVAFVIAFALTGSFFPILIAAGVDALARQAPDSTLLAILGALLVTAVLDFVIFWLRRRRDGSWRCGQPVAEGCFRAAIRDLAFTTRTNRARSSAASPAIRRNSTR